MSNLATIQKIISVTSHPNADALELVQVLGWQVVTKKNEFKEGDFCVYITTDTVLPPHPQFDFLKSKNYRIKPIKLRGVASNGICFPISILSEFECKDDISISEGTDVTEIIGVTKYEKPIPACLRGDIRGGFPNFLIITDEKNLRDRPKALYELTGKPYYISTKIDGCSATYYLNNGDYGVCSRRINLKEDLNTAYWEISDHYNFPHILKSAFPTTNIAIQGEIYGEGIQKNPCGVTGILFSIFNLFNIDSGNYLTFDDLKSFCQEFHLPMVNVIDIGDSFNYTLPELISLSNSQKYENGSFAEGIVIRPTIPFYSNSLQKMWSGKIISENYDDKN
jgi:RNA ligase (TIGR02306 family)